MTTQHPLPSDLLPRLAAAFPHTFFADPQQVQPLKIDIHRDLLAALPAGLSARQAKRCLAWYVNRPAYLKALARGAGRIDLTGAVVDTDIPDPVRSQALQRLETQRRAGRSSAAAALLGARFPAAPLNLEELYAMAVDAKLEITLKFSTLPQAKPAGAGKMAFALRTPDGQFVTAEMGNKLWTKLVKANADWPSWVAALTGAMGERAEKGFALVNPGLQVFEKKSKAADATPMTDTPAPPVAPPPAAPVTVTTGAGTATVTTRNPLSLKRNAST